MEGEKAAFEATRICADLRKSGFSAQTDICGRGLKAQMKYANKQNAKFSAVLGDNEIDSGIIRLKNMETGTEQEIKLADIADQLGKAINQIALAELTETVFNQ